MYDSTEDTKDIDVETANKVEKVVEEFNQLGMKCGKEIAKLAKDMHPDAKLILPLYRSCIVIEQSEEERESGICTMYTYADPHWLGKDITKENLSKEDFHRKITIEGQRDGPQLIYH